MSNKKFPKLAVLSILGILALTSCSSDDEIKSQPSNYDNPIITIDGVEEEIHNNLVSIIADQFQEGDLPSKTLDKVLYRYAQSVFGAYNKVTRADGDETSITLKDAVRDYESNSGDLSVLYKFIREHKVYWLFNDEGKHMNDNNSTDPEDWTPVEDDKTFVPCETEIQNVISKFEDVEKRITENLFTRAKNGGYTSKHFFNEIEFLKSLYQGGADVLKHTIAKDVEVVIKEEEQPNTEPGHEGEFITVQKTGKVTPMIIDYTVEKDEAFSKYILHREFYQTNYDVALDESEDVVKTYGTYQLHYVEKEIVPQVYGDLLIEQYLLDEEDQSGSVKQSRARQINVIKIEKYSGFKINAELLVRQLVDEIYSRVPEGEYLAYIDEANNPFIEIFEKYEDISKGLKVYDPVAPITDKADPKYWSEEQIIARIHASRSDAFNKKTKEEFDYYEHTSFGDLVEDYAEFMSAASFDEIDSSLRDKFTSSGTITPEEGFDQEKISLSQVETITRGWYIKNSAPTLDGGGKIKNNLFQLSVANHKLEAKNGTDPILKYDNDKGLAVTDRFEGKLVGEDVVWNRRTEKAASENNFICSINGAYFLKFDGKPSDADYIDDIVCSDDNAYYICQVIEAAKDVKLRSSGSTNSYANTRGLKFLNKVISEVTTKVAATGSYASLSKEYWLEKMNVTYHDQKVYDYFKSNYPDLFED